MSAAATAEVEGGVMERADGGRWDLGDSARLFLEGSLVYTLLVSDFMGSGDSAGFSLMSDSCFFSFSFSLSLESALLPLVRKKLLIPDKLDLNVITIFFYRWTSHIDVCKVKVK